MYPLASCMFLERCLFRSSAHFLIFFFILGLMSYLYILEINLLLLCLQTFSPILRVVFLLCLQFPLLSKSFYSLISPTWLLLQNILLDYCFIFYNSSSLPDCYFDYLLVVCLVCQTLSSCSLSVIVILGTQISAQDKANASQVVLVVKNLPVSVEDIRDPSSIPALGRSTGEGHGNPLQYSCLENPTGRGPWWTIVHRVSECQT